MSSLPSTNTIDPHIALIWTSPVVSIISHLIEICIRLARNAVVYRSFDDSLDGCCLHRRILLCARNLSIISQSFSQFSWAEIGSIDIVVRILL